MCWPLLCKQGLEHNFTKKQKIYIKKLKKGGRTCNHHFVSKTVFLIVVFFVFFKEEGIFFLSLTKAREKVNK